MRLVHFAGRHTDEVAKVDTTGGDVQTIKLEDNRVRKVLLRLSKQGVSVEMALSPSEAAVLLAEISETVRWAEGED